MKIRWYNPFSWFSPKEQQDYQNPIKQGPRRPRTRDWTEQYTINSELTQGLYHNSYPGFKLSGALAFPPLSVPLYLMGIPVPTSEDEQALVNAVKIIEDHCNDCNMIHLLSHRDATAWVWPFFSARAGRDVWEFIPDDTVCDIVRDIETGEVIMIVTDETILVTTGNNVQHTARRKRYFTKKAIKIEWTEGASLFPQLKSGIFANPAGVLPVAFANNRDGDEVRGHSDYERILTDLKNYHDTDLALSELLVKFSPKMIQQVNDVAGWKTANGITDLNDIDIAKIDFIINLTEKEKTSFEWPSGAHEAGMSKLSQIFWKLVQGSAIPELLWGTKVEGNMSSADNQLDAVIQFVEDKQRQKNEPYLQLITATMRLRNIASMRNNAPALTGITWNALDLISETQKATIFQNFASGMASLFNCAGFTKQMAWKLFQKVYPEATDKDLETFKEGLGEMAKHKAFAAAPYEIIADMTGEEDQSIEPKKPQQPGEPAPANGESK